MTTLKRLKHKKPLRCKYGFHKYQYRFNNGYMRWWSTEGCWFKIEFLEGRECRHCHDFIPYVREDLGHGIEFRNM